MGPMIDLSTDIRRAVVDGLYEQYMKRYPTAAHRQFIETSNHAERHTIVTNTVRQRYQSTTITTNVHDAYAAIAYSQWRFEESDLNQRPHWKPTKAQTHMGRIYYEKANAFDRLFAIMDEIMEMENEVIVK